MVELAQVGSVNIYAVIFFTINLFFFFMILKRRREKKHVICHMSPVTCHMSHVPCHLLLTTTATATDPSPAKELPK